MKKILLVDDSAAIRNILKTALFDDYELLEADNGQTGLSTAAANSVDLFLLDVNMPVMDGISLVKELRQLPHYSRTPIIMLTTESREEKRQAGKEAGATGWIVKPCDPEKLVAVIKKMLNCRT